MGLENKRNHAQPSRRAGTFAFTRTSTDGTVKLIVVPSVARYGGRSSDPRSKEELLALLKLHGLR